MEGRGRMESGGKNDGPTTTKGERRKWIGGREGEGRDLPDQCQSASYAPEDWDHSRFWSRDCDLHRERFASVLDLRFAHHCLHVSVLV